MQNFTFKVSKNEKELKGFMVFIYLILDSYFYPEVLLFIFYCNLNTQLVVMR